LNDIIDLPPPYDLRARYLHRAGYGTASLFGAPHIFYPNANLFDSRHIPFAMGTCQHRPGLSNCSCIVLSRFNSNVAVAYTGIIIITAPLGNKHVRVYREYEYQSIYTPPHEIVHALQTLISDSQVRSDQATHTRRPRGTVANGAHCALGRWMEARVGSFSGVPRLAGACCPQVPLPVS
jgi:hypothetical protein